jgi:uncharacterized membrane protein
MQTIHPLLVHFPVAMLSLYGILEIISGFPIIRKFDLTITKLVLVIIGTLGGMLASVSGEAIEHSFSGLHNLVEMHSTWATLTNFLGIIITALLLVSYFSSFIVSRYADGTIARITGIITRLAQTRALMVILGLCVIISITVTGALGAVIVHGPQVDPVVNFIYTTLLPQG